MNPSQLIANRFELQNILGCGSMGEVHRAIDAQTGTLLKSKTARLTSLD